VAVQLYQALGSRAQISFWSSCRFSFFSPSLLFVNEYASECLHELRLMTAG
jgi:hypothetical protein